MTRATSTKAPKPSRPLSKLLGDGQPILLYDGFCGLCDRFVRFVLRHDKHGSLKFATLQGKYGDAARASAPELARVDSVILLTPSGAYVRSAAALEVMRYLGGIWATTLILYALPRALRDWGYDRVAASRYRLFGKRDACRVPDTDTRARFLD